MHPIFASEKDSFMTLLGPTETGEANSPTGNGDGTTVERWSNGTIGEILKQEKCKKTKNETGADTYSTIDGKRSQDKTCVTGCKIYMEE